MRLRNYYPAIVLAIATLFFAYDIVADLLDDSENLLHILIEALVFLAISSVFFGELRRVGRLKLEVLQQRDKTARLSGELLVAMRRQFAV